MEEREARLKSMLKEMEGFKREIMWYINDLGLNEEAIRTTTVYPLSKVKPMVVSDYPVMHFAYEGMLPLFDNEDDEYNAEIRHYYYRSTFDSFDYKKMNLPLFEKAMIIFVHYYTTREIKDLDNRNTKYVQDAIRLTGITRDDNWQNVWNMNIGFLDEEQDHVQVYVVPMDKTAHFMEFLMENHEEMKQDIKYLTRRKKYAEHFHNTLDEWQKEEDKVRAIEEEERLKKEEKEIIYEEEKRQQEMEEEREFYW